MAHTRFTVKRPSGLSGLMLVLAGQAVSILATNMAGFALSIWVFQRTGSATTLGGMTTALTVPYLLIIPLAGVFVDRYNRKLMMMVSDLAGSVGTVTILILYATGSLQIWHFFAVNVLIGLGGAFQWPAYSAAITTMVPKEHYGRANGMMSLVQAGPGVLAPLLAGALLPAIGLIGILLIEVGTFVVAIGALLMIEVPPPARTVEGREGKGSIWREAAFGFTYIFRRPSLLGLVIILFFGNLFLGFPNSVQVPLVLTRTGNNSLILGSVETAGALSWVVGSAILSAWGGPRRRMHGVLLGWALYAVFGNIVFGLGRSLAVWVPALLLGGFASCVGTASSTALLQAKVAPDVQGRVFAARRMLTWAPDMFTPLLGGALADFVMEPAMQAEGGLARAFGWLVGTAPGAGMSVIMVVFGLGVMATLLAGYLFRPVRDFETILPDHDILPRVEEPTGGQAPAHGREPDLSDV